MPPRLTEADKIQAAASLGISPCAMYAVVQAESGGKGFNDDGSIKIQFEGHVFYRELKKRGINPAGYQAGNDDILYPAFTMRYVLGQSAEYKQLKKASAIDEEAALLSTSFGMFQIMGFNHAVCGFSDVFDFVEAQKRSEKAQLDSFCAYMTTRNLRRFLLAEDWPGFAAKYNGSANVAVYSARIKKAYDQCRNGVQRD
jgi:hypothetical protein